MSLPISHLMWQRQGGNDQQAVGDPTEPIPHMAKQFGLGSKTGIDLPSESAGRIPDPEWKRAYWKDTKDYYCKYAKKGYPKVAKDDPSRARYLESLAENQCRRGYVWRAGDAVNLSIGQGDMLATPLQLARAYAAVANGGTLYSPRIGKAIVRPGGTVVKKIKPPKAGKLPISDRVIRYIQDALADVPRAGTAAGAFAGFPLGRFPVAGKTGTAQAYGEEDTAWFASFAPADDPRYAVVVMVSQGGLGSQAAAPAVRAIYEGIFGVGKEKPALPNGPPGKLPLVTDTGAVKPPSPAAKERQAGAEAPATSGASSRRGDSRVGASLMSATSPLVGAPATRTHHRTAPRRARRSRAARPAGPRRAGRLLRRIAALDRFGGLAPRFTGTTGSRKVLAELERRRM